MSEAKTYAYYGVDSVGAAVSAALRQAGFERVKNAADAEVVLTYFTLSSALEDAYFDAGGLIQSACPGALLIDLSPTTAELVREIGAVATACELQFVEAPVVVQDVTVSDAFGARDNLKCFVAGDAKAVECALPVLDVFAAAVNVAGEFGSAQLMRAAYTLQIAAQVVSAVEADALCRGAANSISSACSSQVSAFPEGLMAQQIMAAICAEQFSGDYTVEMLMAELTAAITTADDADMVLVQAESCMNLLELLAVAGGTDKTPAALALAYADQETALAQGLDWNRASQTFGDACDCGHDHDNCDCGCE